MWLDLQNHSKLAQELKSNLFLNIKPTLLHYSEIPNTCIAIDGQVCRWLFADPIKLPRCTTGSMEPVNGINKDVSGTRLLPMTVSTYPVDWICFCHLLKTLHCCLCPSGRYNLPLATHPPPPPTPPLTPAHPYNVTSVILQSMWKKLLKTQQYFS